MKREDLLVYAKPILFNSEMVRAILEDRKTVTRRVVKRQHLLLDDDCKHEMGFFDTGGNDWACRQLGCGITNTGKSIYRAPYQVGDILYVRETWRVGAWNEDISSIAVDYKADGFCRKEWIEIESSEAFEKYWIQSTDDAIKAKIKCNDGVYNWKTGEAPTRWRPSIHMPKEAARIFLKVTGVRVERLQEITYEGCKAEGITDDYKTYSQEYHDNLARRAYPVIFSELWNSTINKQDLDDYGWEANPYVWVIEFVKINIEVAHNN